MKIILKSRQNGFAIIEALIAFLLLGIGVAALVYLQGSLMGGSNTSKARAEAMELAKDRTEVLRNYINKRQFLSALRTKKVILDNDVEQGVNVKKYNVCYAGIPDIPDNPTTSEVIALLKNPVNLQVTVKWPGIEGVAVTCSADSSKDEKVTLETRLYFMSPIIASGIVTGDEEGDVLFPLISPFITGVEKVHDSTKLQNLASTVEDDQRVMMVDVITGDISFHDVEIDIKTYINSGTGESNVEIIVDGVVKLTSFGGIVHKIEGDIIVDKNANSTLSELTKKGNALLGLFASPPSYCLFSICDGDEDFNPTTDICEKSNLSEFASYICYVPGDCTYGSVDASGDFDSRCPDPTDLTVLPFAPPSGLADLNGGWYGRVGNFHVELPQDKVCAANTDDVSRKTPSREYVTYRCEVPLVNGECPSDSIVGNEGINTPYKAQTFLIVKKQDDCSDRIDDIPESNLVNDSIERNLVGAKEFNSDGTPTDTWEKNIVLPENLCMETFVDVNGDTVHDPTCPNLNSTP